MLGLRELTTAERVLVDHAQAIAKEGLAVAELIPPNFAQAKMRLRDSSAYLLKNVNDIIEGLDLQFYKLDRDIPLVVELMGEAKRLVAGLVPTSSTEIPPDVSDDIQKTPKEELDRLAAQAAAERRAPAVKGMMGLAIGVGVLFLFGQMFRQQRGGAARTGRRWARTRRPRRRKTRTRGRRIAYARN